MANRLKVTRLHEQLTANFGEFAQVPGVNEII